ncbi:uncharacterized protein LOC130549235 [Triplophysa rosa]|uniref:uncharacterized protein LOC130549235 n=1 Tax=Triplophysa rosa TaxID=992332 RepID=UPI002545FA22|nr:uncharacterized protein LOC130549235 [Triplophysa rosa]
MRIIPLQLYVLMWCKAAEALDQLTDLGHNVTINCDLDDEDVYWILQKQSDSPTVILHSFSNPTLAYHFNKTLKNKYSVQSKHRLVIYNITVDELGVYYCMNKDTPPKLSHSTRLNIIEPTQLSEFNTTECKNHTNVTEQNSTHCKTFTLISGLLNAVLIITVIGLIKVFVTKNGCWKISGNCSGQLHETDLQPTQVTEQPQDPNQLQYVAVDFSKLRKNIRPSQDNSTYAALKLPKSKAQEYE